MIDLKTVHENAMPKILSEQKKQAKHHNKNKKKFEFEIGNEVLHRNMQLSSGGNEINAKLLPPYFGLFTVEERIGNKMYSLTDEKNVELENKWHARHLKLFSDNKFINSEFKREEDDPFQLLQQPLGRPRGRP